MTRKRFSLQETLKSALVCVLLLLFPFTVLPGDTSPGVLFIDANVQLSRVLSVGPQVIRHRLVNVNFSQLCELEKASYQQLEPPAVLDLNLFDDTRLLACIHQVEKVLSGGFSCVGVIEDIPGSEIILVVTGDIISANISVPDHIYQVRYISEGVHKVQEVDQSLFPAELQPIPIQLDKIIEPDPNSADVGDYIDVMVVYTAAARSGAGGTTAMENLIDLAVTETNTGYSNSGVNQRIRLVHTAEVVYDETGFDWNTTLTRLRSTSDGYMDDVHTWRDTYSADEVVLIVNDSGYCGIAYLMQTVSTTFAPYAFAVVSRFCATGYYSFAHEMGHNMGSTHDRANASVPGAYNYSYGYQAPDEAFRTIMAYDCPGGCTRVNYWSNPDKTYGGQPMGVVYTDPNAADNRRSLNNTAYTVANFRPSPMAATLLWTRDASAHLWKFNRYGGWVGAIGYGYSSGWTTTSYQTNSDGSAQLLWTRDGSAHLWKFNSSGGWAGATGYGYTSGWTATDYQRNSDGSAQLLWASDGSAHLWKFNSSGGWAGATGYGYTSGWTATGYQRNSDGSAQLLWTRDGSAHLWKFNSSGGWAGATGFGYSSGWTATSYQRNSDGSAQLLWTRNGSAHLWKFNSSGGWAGATGFGYSGWIATSYQNCTNSLTAALQTFGIMLNYTADWTETGYIDRINSSDSLPETPTRIINFSDIPRDIPGEFVQNSDGTVKEVNFAQPIQEDFEIYNELEIPYVIIRKAGFGSGTVTANGLSCGKKCMELIIPYHQDTMKTLKVIPDADSYFAGWMTPEGFPFEDIGNAQPGETVIAVFDIK
jgi:hypothetical protein